jgi:hypothetical protein
MDRRLWQREDFQHAVEAAAAAISRANFDALLGPLKQYLDDPLVRNVNVNGGDRGRVFVEHATHGKFEAPETMERSQREALIGNLANRSSRAVDTLHSRLSCDLPYYRVRVQAFCPPVSDWPLMLRIHAQQPRRLRDRWAAPAALPQRVEELEAAGDLLSKVEAANRAETISSSRAVQERGRVPTSRTSCLRRRCAVTDITVSVT